jgi:putative oxidoreductase
MKQVLFFTDGSTAGLIIRLTLGAMMFPHGAQKLLGVFGGSGYSATLSYFTGSLKLPRIVAFFVIMIEFFGSISLILGFMGSFSATLFICIMMGAIMTTSHSNGLFMNWFGNQKGEGFEYHLLIIGMSMALLFTGSGTFSIDQLILNYQE